MAPSQPGVRAWLAHIIVPGGLVLDLLLWGGDGTGRWGLHLPPLGVVGVTTAAFGKYLENIEDI